MDYAATVDFYREGLELPVLESWDRDPDDRGTLFAVASGIIEVLALPKTGGPSFLWDERPPQGTFMVIEVDDLEARYERAVEKRLPIKQELKDQEWGHRSFCVTDPDGLTLYFFRELIKNAAGRKGSPKRDGSRRRKVR
jgi:catechol 2,3-dioxygenase-like lactoylglutathione lyase family enzyme